MATWDITTGIIVVGSGGGGLTAAIIAKDQGCDVLVLEKGSEYGGTTAMSGGALWIPNNHHMPAAGIPDSPAEALTYLQGITRNRIPEERLAAYIENAPVLLRYLEERTPLKFQIVPGYPDYYPDQAGSRPQGGRTLEPQPVDAHKLGRLAGDLHPLHPQELAMGRMMMTAAEARTMLSSSPEGRKAAKKLLNSYFFNPMRFFARRDTRLTMGNALIAGLRLALQERNIPLWLNTPAQTLVIEEGAVVGLEASRNGRTIRIRATHGVILAAGGFERDREMRKQFQRKPVSETWTAANLYNTGDGIRMGAVAGGSLGLMDEAWWTPTTLVPGKAFAYTIILEKALPGSILVNSKGKRFTNEAAPYSDIVNAMYDNNRKGSRSIPCYLIMDQNFRNRYPLGPLMPGAVPKKYIQNGFVKTGPTLETLAKQCNVDPFGLAEEIQKFNLNAAAGHDPDFHRGENPHDRYYGDSSIQPNPCLTPLDTPPYYAIEIVPGDLGTKGGLLTNADGQVLHIEGHPMEGLYAVGNNSASIMGPSYAGAGATIGPALVFGYLAARHATHKG